MLYAHSVPFAAEGREGGPGDLSSVPSPHAAPRRQRAYGGTGEQQRRSLCIRGMSPRGGGTLEADNTPRVSCLPTRAA